MFPLGTVLFPSLPLLLHVFEPRYRALVEECLGGDHLFGVVLITRGSEVGGGDQRASVGTMAHIEGARSLPDGRWVLAAKGGQRISVVRWLADQPYPCAVVRDDPGTGWAQGTQGGEDDWPPELHRATTAVRRCRALLSELGHSAALPPDLALDEAPQAAAWQLCGLSPATAFDAQRLLEVDDVAQRMHLLTVLMDQLSDDLTRMLGGDGTE